MMRTRRIPLPLLLAAPAILFTLVFYWRGLSTWFQADDFAWMSQWRDVHSARDLLTVLFEPRAQGTIRPLSERAFFLGIQGLFGWAPVPFRLVVFVTQFVNLALLASIALRLTGSRLAGLLAPMFWASSTALAVPMMWNSVYNQILCATCLLGAFRCWIAYCDTASASPSSAIQPTEARRWYLAQGAIFLMGLGVLETMVMYPVLVLSWPAGWKRWKSWMPMFAVSAAFTLLHQSVSPAPKSGPYALHLDASMLATFGEYLKEVFGGPMLALLPVGIWFQRLGLATPLLVGLPLIAFLLWRRDPKFAVPLAFLIAPLIPMLPLRDHITHYYLVTPAAGLALLLAWCFAEIAQRKLGVGALAIAVLFVIPSIAVARLHRDFWYDRGQRVRTLVLGVAYARQIHPGKAIVLTGVDEQQFYASLASDAMRALDIDLVYLAPDSHLNISLQPGEPRAIDFELPKPATDAGLANGNVLIYAPSGNRLRNITAVYAATHQLPGKGETELAERVEPASPIYAAQVGDGWLANGGSARWMGQRAVIYLKGAAMAKLVVEGYCPAVQLARGPFQLTPIVNGTELEHQEVLQGDQRFRLEFALPPTIVPTKKWEIAIQMDHIVPLPDGSHASVLISDIFLDLP